MIVLVVKTVIVNGFKIDAQINLITKLIITKTINRNLVKVIKENEKKVNLVVLVSMIVVFDFKNQNINFKNVIVEKQKQVVYSKMD